MEAHHREHSAPLDRVAMVTRALDAPDLKPGGFVLVDAPDVAAGTFTRMERRRAREGMLNRNPIVADYLIAERVPR
jgi:hypothetical protein